MKSLEEVIKYKLNFLPKDIDPFYVIQEYEGKKKTSCFSVYTGRKTLFFLKTRLVLWKI